MAGLPQVPPNVPLDTILARSGGTALNEIRERSEIFDRGAHVLVEQNTLHPRPCRNWQVNIYSTLIRSVWGNRRPVLRGLLTSMLLTVWIGSGS